MTAKAGTFAFGRNWVEYVNHFIDQDKLEIARQSLVNYLPEHAYTGKVFIDAGCGSGVFSLNALRLGCKKVISFDVDPYSVKATRIVKTKFASLIPKTAQWEVQEGSILNEQLLAGLTEQGDIVYSWGVLHHTGSMYSALENISRIVKPGGYLILAIYNKAPYSDLWLKIKERYNSVSVFQKKALLYCIYGWLSLEVLIKTIKRKILGQPTDGVLFKPDRGMSTLYDLIDWVGGYPYEYATFGEIKMFMTKQGFALEKAAVQIPSPSKQAHRAATKWFGRWMYSYFTTYTANNEFVLRKTGKSAP